MWSSEEQICEWTAQSEVVDIKVVRDHKGFYVGVVWRWVLSFQVLQVYQLLQLPLSWVVVDFLGGLQTIRLWGLVWGPYMLLVYSDGRCRS